MTPHKFAAKWQKAQLTEKSAYQQHFLDLCDLLGQPHPAAVDPEGKWFTFEKGVTTSEGKQGFADVWLKGKFGGGTLDIPIAGAEAAPQVNRRGTDLGDPWERYLLGKGGPELVVPVVEIRLPKSAAGVGVQLDAVIGKDGV